ncbi:MAG: hypothetical protein LBM75_00465 [Myxococcales bacterium]|jgi:hypothetical protein|nr:hypothetical protein [Myxococcales bacterium]
MPRRRPLEVALALAICTLATTAAAHSAHEHHQHMPVVPSPTPSALPAMPEASQPAAEAKAERTSAALWNELLGEEAPAVGSPGSEAAASSALRGEHDSNTAEAVNSITQRYDKAQLRTRLNTFAMAFYRVLAQRNLELLKLLCASPFHFEGRLVETEKAFENEWKRAFANLRLGAQPLKRMQIFSAAEMSQHFGERPAKLAAWPITENSYLSIGEFGAQTIIILWRQAGDLFVAEAIHG